MQIWPLVNFFIVVGGYVNEAVYCCKGDTSDVKLKQARIMFLCLLQIISIVQQFIGKGFFQLIRVKFIILPIKTSRTDLKITTSIFERRSRTISTRQYLLNVTLLN